MRKIIFGVNMTLDGCFDHTAMIADDELHEKAAELFDSADVIIFGRVMYQLMESYWPTATSDPSLSPGEIRFANAINAIKKIVISKTVDHPSWNTSVLRNVDYDGIVGMKKQPGRDILLGGGAKTAGAFMELGLIDEYRIIVHPVILGRGRRLFEDVLKRTDLKLTGENIRKSGAIELIYTPR
jgi:dihydrofolate reductase